MAWFEEKFWTKIILSMKKTGCRRSVTLELVGEERGGGGVNIVFSICDSPY